MADPQANLSAHYRMPSVLGPASGPRNMPHDRLDRLFDGQALQIAIKARSEPAALAALTPPGCELAGDIFELRILQLRNLGWLAGRGYNIAMLRIPVTCDTGSGKKEYRFCPMMWESHADPILTGREELGAPKLFAEIPPPRAGVNGFAGHASWDGFKFLEYEVSDLAQAAEPPQRSPADMYFKYLPRTGAWGEAEVSYLTVSVKGENPPIKLREHRVGSGRFAFHHARWEDMPTQYGFVNALAGLPILSFEGAEVLDTDGMADLRAQQILRQV